MFNKITKKNNLSDVEKMIDEEILKLAKMANTKKQFEDVMDLLDKRKKLTEKKTVSPDTIALILGNLIGIAMVLGYEKANVITSKAFGMVVKGRV